MSTVLTQRFLPHSVNMNTDDMVEDASVNSYSPLVLTAEVRDPGKCQIGKTEGVCISGESCFKHGGQAGNFCNGSSNLICCTCKCTQILLYTYSIPFTSFFFLSL